MKGILTHLLLTLRLNFRARQALVYGYLVPVFFLIAFGSVFHSSAPPLLYEMGQLVTITVLGGACFGIPTAMVAERERGVWRRSRLLPGSTAGLIVSAMVARYIIVLLAVVMQFGLAWCLYRTPFPAHPFGELAAFSAVCFAFLGMGLMIAMLAGAVPAVQALGQAIFLPMILIGGVGVPLRVLPGWARILAGYLPGRYAVEALDASYLPGGTGLAGSRFALVALIVIGVAACVAGSRMFRWDSEQKVEAGAKVWIVFALAAWAGVGVFAQYSGRSGVRVESAIPKAPWEEITTAQIASVSFAGLTPDDSDIAPIEANMAGLSAASKARVGYIGQLLLTWAPGQVNDPVQRVHDLLYAASVFDIDEDPDEGAIGRTILDYIRKEAPGDDLEKILTYIIKNPDSGSVITKVPELGAQGEIAGDAARDRSAMYATKLLERIVGK
jgi:ABC-2 type transport system permease protein